MVEWIDGHTDIWNDAQVHGWMFGWIQVMGGCTDAWMDVWMYAYMTNLAGQVIIQSN